MTRHQLPAQARWFRFVPAHAADRRNGFPLSREWWRGPFAGM